MIGRYIGASVRSILIMVLVAAPALLVPAGRADDHMVVALVGLFMAVLVFLEYSSRAPELLSFREASPFNRVRFAAMLMALLLSCAAYRAGFTDTTLNHLSQAVGALVAQVLDFPGSPLRLMVNIMPPFDDPTRLEFFETALGASFAGASTALGMFLVQFYLFDWLPRVKAFNLWINLPNFDPTAGGNIVRRLMRMAGLNFLLALFMPALFPAVVKAAWIVLDLGQIAAPLTIVWMAALWAYLPVNFLMRGLAIRRIAVMVDRQRKAAARAKLKDPLAEMSPA